MKEKTSFSAGHALANRQAPRLIENQPHRLGETRLLVELRGGKKCWELVTAQACAAGQRSTRAVEVGPLVLFQ
jgi:hypothetical protein